MEFHKDTIDGLRNKEYGVGAIYTHAEPDGFSAHPFITVDRVDMPIELATELNLGQMTLAEIVACRLFI